MRYTTPDLHRAAFDTYEIIFSCNMREGDDSMIKSIRMGSIIGEVEMRVIKNFIHVSKLQANLFLVSKFLSNGWKG